MLDDQVAKLFDAAQSVFRQGNFISAADLARQALNFKRTAQCLEFLGECLIRLDQFEEAVNVLSEALEAAPNLVVARALLAHVLKNSNDPASWLVGSHHAQIAVALDPGFAGLQANLAALRHKIGANDPRALREMQRAVILNDQDPEFWFHYGSMLYDWGQFTAADAASRNALCLNPSRVESVHGHAEAKAVVAGHHEAAHWFDRLVALDPGRPKYRVARGTNRLAIANWTEGWAGYEWRRHYPAIFGLPAPKQDDSKPQPLAGKTVLVYPEQGFGDILQFIRFVPPLAQQAAKVYLCAWQELAPLLAEMPGARDLFSIVDPNAAAQLHADISLPVMSLPRLLEAEPNGTPYLSVPSQQRERWAHAVAGLSGLRVGICWSGGVRPLSPIEIRMADRRRSIPLEVIGNAISGIPNVSFVSLQNRYRDGDNPSDFGIRDASAFLRDFSDVAGLISNLDLVITVDTAVAHLAGALNVRTWMLNRFDTCWRWERGATRTRWYDSMTIFPQIRPMDWSGPLANVAASLENLAAKQAAQPTF